MYDELFAVYGSRWQTHIQGLERWSVEARPLLPCESAVSVFFVLHVYSPFLCAFYIVRIVLALLDMLSIK